MIIIFVSQMTQELSFARYKFCFFPLEISLYLEQEAECKMNYRS